MIKATRIKFSEGELLIRRGNDNRTLVELVIDSGSLHSVNISLEFALTPAEWIELRDKIEEF